jgi:hypothetical protein
LPQLKTKPRRNTVLLGNEKRESSLPLEAAVEKI